MFSRISRYPSPSCDCDSFPSSNQILHLSTIQSDLQGIKLDSTFKHDSTLKSCFGLLLCSTFKLCSSQSVPASVGSYFSLSLLWLVTLLWSIFVPASIAEKIMIMHEECLEGNYNSVARLRESNPPTNAVAQSRQAANDEDDDESSRNSNSSEMMVDFRGSEPNDNEKNMMIDEPKRLDEAAEDGWVTVGPKRNGGRRN